MFCTQTFKNAAEKDDHILQHFAQETCNECQQNLIRIGGNLYVLHNAATCIREYDYDNENYYDDVSSKLATVLVEEGTYLKDEPNDQENRLEEDALEVEVGEWLKSEPNYDEYEHSENPLQEEDDVEEEEEEATAESNMDDDSQPQQEATTSTAESNMDDDSQQQQQQQQDEANTSAAESINDENMSQEAMDLSKSNEVNIKLESVANTNDKEKSTKKEENKRECEFCGEFFHRYALYRHKRDVHNPTVCVCQICYTQFKSEEYLQRHMRYKHGATANVFKCDKCQATFRKEDLFRIHQCNGVKPNSKMACEICSKEFSRKQSLLNHQVLVHSKSETIHCKACARVFSDVDERDAHQSECAAKKYQQLSKNSTACEICGVVLSRSSALLRHKASKH